MSNRIHRLRLKGLDCFNQNVSVPSYNRQDLTAGIVHIGVGNFHRAHQAWYLDQLFEAGYDHDWALIGAGVRANDRLMREALLRQDCLSSVVELNEDKITARICGAMIDFVDVNSEHLIVALTEPDIRIVSLTITEGGYFTDDSSGAFLINHSDIQHDIENPNTPNTVFGVIVAALKRRKEVGAGAFTVMSCDNISHNGDVTKQAVIELASVVDPKLGVWIKENAAFPNSVVDCITPATSQLERELVAKTFGFQDSKPVTCEPFRQWVIEDNFSQGRPSLERVGVKFVKSAAPYEIVKLRILNGGHFALAVAAVFMNHNYVHEAMADPLILGFLKKLFAKEVIHMLPEIADVDFQEYCELTLLRFSNSRICDTIERLCFDTSSRFPKFVLPSILDNVAQGKSTPGLALVVALWCHYCDQACKQNSDFDLNDPRADSLEYGAMRSKQEPLDFLKISGVFDSLSSNEMFKANFTRAIELIRAQGVRSAIESYIL